MLQQAKCTKPSQHAVTPQAELHSNTYIGLMPFDRTKEAQTGKKENKPQKKKLHNKPSLSDFHILPYLSLPPNLTINPSKKLQQTQQQLMKQFQLT